MPGATKKNKKSAIKKKSKVNKAKAAVQAVPAAGKMMNYHQVISTYLMAGSSAVERLLIAKRVTADTVRKAAVELRKSFEVLGKDQKEMNVVDILSRVVDEVAPRPGKGKSAPEPGMTRDYKSQFIDGKHSMRLPLDTLVKDKGTAVSVRYEKDRIIVMTKQQAQRLVRDERPQAASA